MIRPDLRLRRLLPVWAPLAATFLLVTGATPVVNASINRLPGRVQEVDLAAFAVLQACLIVLHSPLFVTREIAIKLSVNRAGARAALRFCTGAALCIAALEIVLGATPLGAHLLGLFTERRDVLAGAHRAFLFIWPMPILIAVRGVYQAHQIRVDDTLFVGFGTLLRLVFTALIGLLLAPRLGLDGPTLGSICLVVGVFMEMLFSWLRARARARPPEEGGAGFLRPLRFGLPLMFANFLGVAASLFYLRIAGLVPTGIQQASLAAYQEVRPLHWIFTAGAMALQSLTTAKVAAPEDGRAMLRFGIVVGAALSLLLGLVAFTPPLRTWVLVDVLGERADGLVFAYALPALGVAATMPFLNAVRFTFRGILIARGHTRAITLTNLLTLALLAGVVALDVLPFEENGTLNAYVIWTATLLLEVGILGWVTVRARGVRSPLPPPLRSPREATAG